MNLSLSERLRISFRARHSTWISSGELQRHAAQSTTYTPSNVSRRLRELQEEQFLQVEYRKGHAWYRLHPKHYEVALASQENV